MSMNDHIDLAARVILDACQSRRDLFPATEPISVQAARQYAQALDEAGLLSPAPLREEWGSELQGARPESSSHVLYARDPDNAKWQIENNPDHATGRVMHRYRTDWLPVNSDEEVDQ